MGISLIAEYHLKESRSFNEDVQIFNQSSLGETSVNLGAFYQIINPRLGFWNQINIRGGAYIRQFDETYNDSEWSDYNTNGTVFRTEYLQWLKEFGWVDIQFSIDGIEDRFEFMMDLKNNKRGRIKEYANKFNAEYFEGKRPWHIKCDIAIPAATQNEINLNDAKNLIKNKCQCIVEGANMPTESDAVEEFLKNKVLFGPGKAANAGGVAVSGLEMSQNSMFTSWSREEVDSKLKNIMRNIHQQCVKYGSGNNYINYIKGANIAGFIKVADAMLDQGVV